jgi:hypothetical protein
MTIIRIVTNTNVDINVLPLSRYTKYLYPLECRKKNLSNPTELQAAIEGNKREGRRGSYGSFPSSDMMPLPHHALGGIPGMPSQISPMSLVTSHQRQFNGSSHHGMPPSKTFEKKVYDFDALNLT